MARQIVEDVGLGEVVHLVLGPDRDGGRKLAPAQAVEEEEAGDVPAHRFGLETGERLELLIDVGEPWNPVGRKIQGLDAAQEMAVGVPFPAWPNAPVELAPSLMILFRIQVVSL
jgi:hypothetical protein